MADLQAVNEIVDKVVENIKNSKDQLFLIIASLQQDYERKVEELARIKIVITETIHQVDQLEVADKKIRQYLLTVSKTFDGDYEERIKVAYEKAMQIRVQLGLKQEYEKTLRKERSELEIELRQALKNIESAEIMAQQVSIAMKYLEKDLVEALGGKAPEIDLETSIYILEAQESERARIGREIHDGPAQHMANVLMTVDFCKMVIGKDLDAGLKELDNLKQSVKVALKEVRRILFDLKPLALEKLGLNKAIEELIENTIIDTDLKVIKSIKEVNNIELVIQVAIYRIMQEIINNIRKHAKATQVDIKLDAGSDMLILVISDNGIGFNVEEIMDQVSLGRKAYGLTGILERVQQLNGKINIKSNINEGTTFYVKLPVK